MKNYCIGKINPTHPQFRSFIERKMKYHIAGAEEWPSIVTRVSYWLTGVIPDDPFCITSNKGRTIVSCYPGNTRAIGAYLTKQTYPVIYKYTDYQKLNHLVIESRPLDKSDWDKYPQLLDPEYGRPGFLQEAEIKANHLFEETDKRLRDLWKNKLYFEKG